MVFVGFSQRTRDARAKGALYFASIPGPLLGLGVAAGGPVSVLLFGNGFGSSEFLRALRILFYISIENALVLASELIRPSSFRTT